eukprot:139664-Rhodomonas_salina.2
MGLWVREQFHGLRGDDDVLFHGLDDAAVAQCRAKRDRGLAQNLQQSTRVRAGKKKRGQKD